jgi:acid stress-induced BolA-like protein IbaG/YrbA
MERIAEIEKVFERLGLEKLEIDMEESGSGKIVGFVVSKSFEGMSQTERQNYVWDHLEKELSEEQHKRIRVIITMTPEESDEAELEAA